MAARSSTFFNDFQCPRYANPAASSPEYALWRISIRCCRWSSGFICPQCNRRSSSTRYLSELFVKEVPRTLNRLVDVLCSAFRFCVLSSLVLCFPGLFASLRLFILEGFFISVLFPHNVL